MQTARFRLTAWMMTVAILAIGGTTASAGSAAETPPGVFLTRIPPRPVDAVSGSAFVQELTRLPPGARQEAILAELLRGNIPSFLRQLRPAQLTLVSRMRKRVSGTAWVMPDYLAVGSNTDFVRVPLDRYTASAVAREFGLSLPTRKIVNAVYRQAAVQLPPVTMTPGPRMRSPAYVLSHNEQIEQQRHRQRLGVLTAGHKKDLVLTNRLGRRPARVAIYGWHRLSGRPIQPLSTLHGAGYADYSHGARLVSRTVVVDGVSRDLYDLLADRILAGLVSDEGRIVDAPAFMNISRGSPSPAPAS